MVDAAVQQDPGHGVDGEVVAGGRARAGDAGEVDRRGGVHEGQRHELGEAGAAVLAGRSCIRASTRRWATQWRGWSTWPYIIVEVVGQPTRWAVETTSIQVRVGSLPLVSTQRTSSSRISAAVPGSEPSPASRALMQEVLDGRGRCGRCR